MMDDVEETRGLLLSCANFNGGIGLIVHPSLAKRLKAAGIDGPYAISRKIDPDLKITDEETQ